MASTGINNGTLLAIYVGGTKVTHGVTTSFEVTMATRDISTKDTAGWAAFGSAIRSWSGSGSFYFAEDAAYGFSDLFASIGSRTAVTLVFKSGVTDDLTYTGSAFITSLSRSGGVEDNEQYDVSFQGTGVLTEVAA